MAKRVAVITDATSAGYFFPYWVGYYGGLFDQSNLYVLTYQGLGRQFDGYRLGAVWEVDQPYTDAFRARCMSDLVTQLLQAYDVVVRCDVDEFLAPHPLRHGSLASYIETLALPYVTSIGLDVVDMDDPPLRLDGTLLLAQRKYCVRTMSLNKTSIVRIPVAWSIGFHYGDVHPRFDDLYLFHMKFADVHGRIPWFDRMLELFQPGSTEHDYYSDARGKLEGFCRQFRAQQPLEGWAAFESKDFLNRFLESVEYVQADDVYVNAFEFEHIPLRIPEEFGRFF